MCIRDRIRTLQSLAMRSDGWTPPIIKTVASQALGIEELADAVASYEDYLKKKNLVMNKSVENWQQRLVEMLRDTMPVSYTHLDVYKRQA